MNKRIKRVLLCRPDYFTVDYIINPLMQPHAVDSSIALSQWNELKTTYEKLGINVEVIEQASDVPDMVFATDQAIVRDDELLLANFHYEQRRKESLYYREWFKQKDYTIKSLSSISFFEGGDTRILGNQLFIGSGFRTSQNIADEISDILGLDTVQLSLVNPEFYHLDMAFLPISSETAIYYPDAFDATSKRKLAKFVKNLIPISLEIASEYACNSVVSGSDLITQCIDSEFTDMVQTNGLKSHVVDVSEFNKAGGGIRCLTLVLE